MTASSDQSGFAVGIFNGASGVVSATIEEPRLGGIIVDEAQSATIADSDVTGCQQGSGIVLRGSGATVIRQVRVERCTVSMHSVLVQVRVRG